MGAYYRIDNHDKCESIDLYQVTNIKAGAFQRWSLQQAVLNVFLGFALDYRWPEWSGRWELNRIRIHCDGEDDAPSDEWPDAGILFLTDLDKRGDLDGWIRYIGWSDTWVAMHGTEDLRKWVVAQGALQ
jgi:hypothetical protein